MNMQTASGQMTGEPQRAPRTPARAEIVGSLLKPPRLHELFQRVYGEYSAASTLDEKHRGALDELLQVAEEEIERVVEQQIACGLDVISDGELRRALFTNSFYDAIEGVEASPDPVPCIDEQGNTFDYEGPPVITGRLRQVASPAAHEVTYLKSITDHPFKVTFPAGSWFCLPYLFKSGVTDKAYRDPEELVEHALEIQRALIRDAIDAGARYIQFDWPAYAILVDDNWQKMIKETWDIEPDELLKRSLAADRAVLDGIPDHVTKALHFCRGNHKSAWITSGPLDFVAEPMFDLPYDKFLIEWDNVSREGDFSALRYVRRGGPVVALGIISTKKPELESDDVLMQRIEEATAYVDIDQLAISPQCGFASTWYGNLLDESDQWRKLEALGRIANRVWPSNPQS